MKIPDYHNIKMKISFICFFLTAFTKGSFSQKHILSLKDVLNLVQLGQPQLQSYREQTTAAKYNIGIAKNTLVPDLTAGYQAGYTTFNNITGMSYPGLMMRITGPPSSTNSYSPVPGTALAALFQWTPLTFGQRQAAIDKASAQFQLAGSNYDKELFKQEFTCITTYLGLIYLKKLLESQQANLERTKVSMQQSLVLAKEGLRPGLDTVQFQSALAQAEMDLLNTQRLYYSQVLELQRLTGLSGTPENLELSDSLLAAELPTIPDTAGGYIQNPDYKYYQAQVEVSAANLNEIEHVWRPKLDIWANAYARGSGVDANGTIDKSYGWSLSRNNIGAGLQLSFPILQFSKVNIQKKQYRSLLKADESQLAQVSVNLQKQIETAQFNYRQNLLVAAQAPILSRAALYAYEGLKLSYSNGLVDFTRLTQGQYQ
ncbi:MAG TPA: TolC family protein, partial [Nitrosopumilaceae archaeon]|nr:TolC family protein [Nitrosopumilaceae archaeon]